MQNPLAWYRITLTPVHKDDKYETAVYAADAWAARMYAHEQVKAMQWDTLTTLVTVRLFDRANQAVVL